MKKRLVGAAILVSLFVIFTPMVLDPNRLGSPEEASPIPPPPNQPFPGRLLRLDAPTPDLSPPPEPLAEGVPFEEPAEPLPPPDPGPVLPPAPAGLPAAAGPPVRPSASAGAKPADKASATPTPPPVATPPPVVTAPVAPPAGAQGAEDAAARPGDSRVGLSAWAVQLSSFANAANAIALRDALRGRGFVAFVESAPDRTTRVYLGPDLQKGNAVAAQQRLARDLGIKGAVVPYPAPVRPGGAAGDAGGTPPRP